MFVCGHCMYTSHRPDRPQRPQRRLRAWRSWTRIAHPVRSFERRQVVTPPAHGIGQGRHHSMRPMWRCTVAPCKALKDVAAPHVEPYLGIHSIGAGGEGRPHREPLALVNRLAQEDLCGIARIDKPVTSMCTIVRFSVSHVCCQKDMHGEDMQRTEKQTMILLSIDRPGELTLCAPSCSPPRSWREGRWAGRLLPGCPPGWGGL